jgi:hypothetical protein
VGELESLCQAGVGLARPMAGSSGKGIFGLFFHFDLLFLFSLWFFCTFLEMMMC